MVAIYLAIRWPLSDLWSNSGFLELASAVSTLILIVGAVIEEWPKLTKIALLAIKAVLLRSTSFERCVLKKLVLHSAGAILVVAGIAGELIFETRTFIVEDTASENLKQKAEDAAQSAKTAHSEADAAKTASGNALNLARSAHAEADGAKEKANSASLSAEAAISMSRASDEVAKSAETDAGHAKQDAADARQMTSATAEELADEHRRRIELEQILQPRYIGGRGRGEPDSSLLREFTGMNIKIEVVRDVEAIRAASGIASTLSSPDFGFGWKLASFDIKDEPSGIVDGVSVSVCRKRVDTDDSKLAGDVLLRYLLDCKWDVDAESGESGDCSPNTIRVRVGLKPPTYFLPDRVKWGKERARARSKTTLEQEFKQRFPKPK